VLKLVPFVPMSTVSLRVVCLAMGAGPSPVFDSNTLDATGLQHFRVSEQPSCCLVANSYASHSDAIQALRIYIPTIHRCSGSDRLDNLVAAAAVNCEITLVCGVNDCFGDRFAESHDTGVRELHLWITLHQHTDRFSISRQ
jgi:hypothetical protein